MPPNLYLIDGHALAYRTYFALTAASPGGERWQTKSGEPTAGIYGFASVLLRILEQDHPEYLAVAFDTGKTFRDEIFPEYKATRAKMPDDLKSADMEKTVTGKAEVINWLKRSLDAVKSARASLRPADLQSRVKIEGRDATVDGMYLRIIIHDNEHMGQLVAYARMNGIVPPWSEGGGKR